MKSKHLLLTLLLALFVPWAANAQTLTVHDASGTNKYVPFYGYYADKDQTNQMIYPATELADMNGKAITEMVFYWQEGYNYGFYYGVGTWTVSLGETTATTLSGLDNTTSLTPVFTGVLDEAGGLFDNTAYTLTIAFDDQYVYGGGNLLVQFSHTGTDEYEYYVFEGESVTGASYCYGSQRNFLPKTTFTYEMPAAFPSPKNLQISDITAETATASWEAPTSATPTGYQYQYKFAETPSWPDTWNSINDTHKDLVNLFALKTYDFRVRANYAGGDSEPIEKQFTTKATPVAVGDSWSDNFEGDACGWELINGSLANKWCWGTATNNGGTHSLYVSNDNGATNSYSESDTKIFATKLLTFIDSKYTFAFDWKCKGENNYDFLRVALVPASQTLTAGSDYNTIPKNSLPTGWIAVDGGSQLNQPNATTPTWQNKEVTINVTAGTYYVVLAWRNDPYAYVPAAAVDNFSITRLLCPYDVAGLAYDPESVTAHEATVNWTDGEPGSWQVAWSKDNTFAAANTQTEIVNTNTINLTTLDASSTYYVKVRAYCGGEDYGTWCNAINFDTECEAITTFPWEEKFETVATGNFVKLCWSNTVTSGSNKFKVSTTTNGTNSTHQLYSPYYSNAVAKLVLPEMTIPTGKDYQFIIDVYRTTYSTSYDDGIRVYASTDGNLEGATELGFLYRVCTKTDNGVVTAETTTGWYTYTFDIPFDGSCFIILQGEGKGGNYTYVDNLIVRQAPDCATPTGLAVTANSQTPEGATITWTAGDATSWIVEYKKSTEEDYTALAEPVTSPTHTFVGLDPATTYNVRVKVNCTTGEGVTFPTDPVNFTTEAACPAPKNLVVSGITATQATLTWTPGYDETAWTVKYKKHSDTDYITAPTVSGTPTCTVYDLTGGTVYDVQIIGCDPTHIYTVSSAFTTAFGVPFLEEFATSSIPSGWNQYTGLLTPEVLNGTTPLSTGGSWTFNNTTVLGQYHTRLNIYGTTCKSWLLTPNIVLTANQSLNFDLALTDYGSTSAIEFPEGQADDKFVVLITTNNGATWSILRQWDNAGSEYVYNNIYYKGEEVYIDLAAYSGQTVRIAFYGESTIAKTGEDNDLHIDNVSIDNTPTCFRPTAVTDSNVTNHSANISWTPGETGQSAWQIAYKKGETFDPTDPALDWNTITTVNVTENPTYTFDKVFDAASNYYFYVRANCGTTAEPDYSAWSKKVCVIATEAAAPAPTTFAKTNVGPDYVDLYWNKPAGDYLSGYGIYYSTSSTDPTAETEAIETITVIEAPTAEAPYTLSGLTANTKYYFWIRANHEANVYSSWKAINGSYFTTPEACAKPTSLAASEPSPTSIKLSWTAGATWQTSWVIAYSKTTGFDPTDPDACTYVDADENPFVVEGLDSEETYYFRVKGDCDTYGESAWNLYEASETTLIACPAPTDIVASNLTQNTADLTWTGYSDNYNIRYRALTPAAETQTTTEDFSGYTATSYSQEGSLPEGWKGYSSYTYTGYKPHVSSNSALGSSYDLEGFAGGATSTDNFLYMIGNSTYPYSSYTILPQISDLEAFSFDYGFENASNGTLTVGYCTDNTSGSTFTAFNDLTITGSTTSVTVSLTAADIATLNANNGYLTFSWVYSSSYGVGIDNVAITTRTYTPGEWIDPVLTSNTEAISLDELTAGTKYEVQVQAVCDPTSSDWSESCKFTTYGADTKVFTNAANDGLWGTAGNWAPTGAPGINENAILRANANIAAGTVAEAKKITFEGTPTRTLTIADGGQLKTDNNVYATVKKTINAYPTEGTAGYYLIGNPLSSTIYSSGIPATGMTTGSYDLYQWNYTAYDGLEWRNYEASTFSLYNAQGYLYANAANTELTFTGSVLANNTEVEKTSSYTDDYVWKGWSLWANPFVCNAYITSANVNLSFYRMNADGSGFEAATGAIAPMEGIFVQATGTNQKFKFTRTAPDSNSGQGNLNINLTEVVTTRDKQPATDNAIICFGGSSTLEKFSFRQGSTKVFITEEGKDYAVVNAESNVGEIPVSFEAKNNGTYTLSFTNEEVSFAYLHLIDNMTGIETDLLANPSYTFEARTTDYASRFKLVFATGSSTGSDTFAYYSNGNWVINNEGRATLQVVDVNGRILKSESINGCANVNFKAAAGIYMIRLVNGDNVKVQKVVVR